MKPLALSSATLTTALGLGLSAQSHALQNNISGLKPNDFQDCPLPTWIGEVANVEACALPLELQDWTCRNNQLAELALQQDGFLTAVAALKQRYGAHRIGLFLGTSTSGIGQTETAYKHRTAAGALPTTFHYRQTHNFFSCAGYVQQRLELQGPTQVISTACSSSAKVFATAARMIKAGFCDAAIVGGVDSLCQMTLYGFNSLQLVSTERCRPCDIKRDGISIGEAAGFAIVEPSAAEHAQKTHLLGYGESSDAYHMSSPHPEGAGAQRAMHQALSKAQLQPDDIDYINMHGTSTPANDQAEGRAIAAIFGHHTPSSSTKGWTGHTLGAAGIVEALFSSLCITDGFIPQNLGCTEQDPDIQCQLVAKTGPQKIHRVLSNSFGFGGSNCSLVLGALA